MTTFFTAPAPVNTSSTMIGAVIIFINNDQVPDGSPVTVTTVPNGNGVRGLLNLFGKSDTWGSLAGNGDIANGVATLSNLTVGGNNLSTVYSGKIGQPGLTWNLGSGNLTGGNNVASSFSNISLTKVGAGTLALTSANQYTGVTNINGGALLVGNGGAGASLANTTVTVGNGTTAAALGGNGTIAGPVTMSASGHLAPAVSPSSTSTLTINNNLTLNAGGTLAFNFAAPASLSSSGFGSGDVVAVGGTGSLTM